MKAPTTKSLKKKLWEQYFSPYIRQKECGKCFSCGVVKNWKEMDAGHFIHSGRHSSLAFDENSIIHCQCSKCNTFRHGNLANYAVRMVEKYGIKKVKQFQYESQKVKKWTVQELLDLIEYYKKKLDRLNDSK